MEFFLSPDESQRLRFSDDVVSDFRFPVLESRVSSGRAFPMLSTKEEEIGIVDGKRA